MNRPLAAPVRGTGLTAHGTQVDLAHVGEAPLSIERQTHDLEVLVDELIKARNANPKAVQVHAMQIAGAYGRLQWLVSALQESERLCELRSAKEPKR